MPLAQFEHDPAELLCPFAHAAHPVLAAFTVQPDPLLHEACFCKFCHWPPGHALHPAEPVSGSPCGSCAHAWSFRHVEPAGQWGWCGWCACGLCGWCG